MRVLALDIATTTGWAVMDSPENLICYGTIKIKSKWNYQERFRFLREKVLELVQTYKPTHVAIEDTFTGVNPKTTALLNYMKGVCMEALPPEVILQSGLAISIRCKVLPRIPKVKKDPKEKKKKVKSNVEVIKVTRKELMFHYVVAKFKLEDFSFKKHNDITDAIGLCLWSFITNTNS